VKEVTKCPYCGFEGELWLIKTWKYKWWIVHFYECPKCGGRSGFYLDLAGKYKSFVIKFKPRIK